MFSISDILVDDSVTIREAIKLLDQSSKKIILVVDGSKRLKGVMTDGDVRRWILKNGSLEEKVSMIMNTSPIYVHQGQEKQAFGIMKDKYIDAIPVIDYNGEIVNIVFWNEKSDEILLRYGKIDAPVVIMAGGKGTRLYPYTKILPKPLIPIGEIPIVERIIDKFYMFGSTEFFLTINYKMNMIKSYFIDLDTKYTIKYIEENKPLGTAGSLYLLKDRIQETFFLSNCDILVDANYSNILNFHKENRNKITMITSMKSYLIPYGIVKLDNKGSIISMQEKPEFNFLVNTGVYVLEPEVLQIIPENQYFDITSLIEVCMDQGLKVGTYPVSENSWFDMGEFDSMEAMASQLDVSKY